jgi:hypothetical protein
VNDDHLSDEELHRMPCTALVLLILAFVASWALFGIYLWMMWRTIKG